MEPKPNARWSLDFVYDPFANGRRSRVLSIVDDVIKECLSAIPDTSISGQRVARELTAIVERRSKPSSIFSENGTQFTCNAMLAWCKDTGSDWHFSAPGKPIAFVDSFNSLISTTPEQRSLRGSRTTTGTNHTLLKYLTPATYAHRNGQSAAHPDQLHRQLLHCATRGTKPGALIAAR